MRLQAVEGAVVCARVRDADAQLMAYVTCRAGHAVTPDGLRTALRATLPAHMVPTGIVILEHFPLTPHGKIDRQALRQLNPTPPTPGPDGAPATDTELLLAEIWKDIFSAESVGRHDSFFDRGGDSLRAMVVAARVHS